MPMIQKRNYQLVREKPSRSSEDRDGESLLEPEIPHQSFPLRSSNALESLRPYKFGIILGLLNFVLVILLLLVFLKSTRITCMNTTEVPSPANNAISYERVMMNNSLFDDNVYKGYPNEAQTEAWSYYNNLSSIAVGIEDLQAIGKTSVQLMDGSNRYLAMLDVFHQLHCLDKIRLYIHRDYYQLRETPAMQFIHVGHCIDSLRQIIMCRADTELITFHYVSEKDYPNPLPNPDFLVERKCSNWDKLVEWVKHHQASRDDSESRASWEQKHGPAPPPG